MTRYDQQIIFAALAFVAVALKSDSAPSEDTAHKAKKLAASLNSFCDQNIHSLSLIQKEAFSSKEVERDLDALIDKHISELHERETTSLPSDSTTLMQMYVRLQFRNIIRQNDVLFSMTTPQRMVEFVRGQLENEIENLRGKS